MLSVKRIIAACGVLIAGATAAPVAGAIEGGHNAGRTPWIAQVNVAGLCTGTVIAPKWVLTARHCVNNLNTGELMQTGSVKLGERATGYHRVDRVVPQPTGADAALVHTATRLPVAPATLAGQLPEINSVGQISGWGKGRFPLQQGTAHVERYYDDAGRDNAKMFTTRGVSGNQEPGDSGGPYHQGRTVYGVLSTTGPKNDAGKIMANYTDVSHIAGWITSTISQPAADAAVADGPAADNGAASGADNGAAAPDGRQGADSAWPAGRAEVDPLAGLSSALLGSS